MRKIHKKIIGVMGLLIGCFLMNYYFLTVSAATEAAVVTLRVEQLLKTPGSASGVDTTFHYNLSSTELGNPMPVGSRAGSFDFMLDGNDAIDMEPMFFFNTGIYRYSISGTTVDKTPEYHIDKQRYAITVYVKEIADILVTEVIVTNSSGSKVDNIQFVNTYTPSETDPSKIADPRVQKTVVGNPSQQSVFTFLLTAENLTNPMPMGSQGGGKMIRITGSGDNSFGAWKYTGEGIYRYTISEKNAGEAGYTYDPTVYTIIDTVKDMDGQLEVARMIMNNSNKQVESCVFVNEYRKGIMPPKTGDNSASNWYAQVLAIGSFTVVGCMIGYKRRIIKNQKSS